jgi:foldase protein PrsA
MRKRALFAAAVPIVVAVLVAACGGVTIPSGAIAVVNDGVVTKAQFDSIIRQAKAQAKTQGVSFPAVGSPSYDSYAAQVVNYLVTQELLDQYAAQNRITVTDKQVNDRITQLEKAYGGKKGVDKILKQQGMTRADLTKLTKDELLDQAVYNKITKSAKVTDAEALAYYNKNKSQYETPEQRDIRHILVKTKAEALKVRALLVADPSNATWKKLAKQYSIDPGTKDSGGELGLNKAGAFVPAFDKVAFSLKLNQISQPVQTQYGWHIIQVTKIEKATSTSFAKAKAGIKSTLLSNKQSTIWSNWLKKLTKDAKIAYADGYDPEALQKAASASPSATAAPSASPSHTASSGGSGGASPSSSGSSSAAATPSPSASATP